MSDLFLLTLDTMAAYGSGVFEPPLHGFADPAVNQLVAWESEPDEWDGGDLIEAYPPWFLASARLCEAIVSSGLTGLRRGNVASLAISKQRARLMELGEIPALPPFHIVVPDRGVMVRGREPDSIGSDEPLYYADWPGDDFTSSRWGPVLTRRALDVVRSFGASLPSILSLEPAPERF